MKRRLLGPVAAVMLLSTSSCEHLPDLTFVDQIQQAVIRKCSFVPTIKAILTLLTANPSWTNAAEIADRICAVVPQPRGPRAAPFEVSPAPILDKVPINGWYVTAMP